MKLPYNPIEEEKNWWKKGQSTKGDSKNLPPGHVFAHAHVRQALILLLNNLNCNSASRILEIGCGAETYTLDIAKMSQNIYGVDISEIALKGFNSMGFQSILADAKKLPFKSNSFDFVLVSATLHHLVRQGPLKEYIIEFMRVTKRGGYVIAMEPNCFHPSGILMNVFNTIKPGITGLVPHESALSPLYLTKIFSQAGAQDIRCLAASYVWNRFPLSVSQFISRHEQHIRVIYPFNLFGWFEIIYGKKGNPRS